ESALRGTERVDAGGEQREDGLRQTRLTVLLTRARVRAQLLDEEWVAFRPFEGEVARLHVEEIAREEPGREPRGLVRAERIERGSRGVRLAASPGRTLLEQLGAGDAEQEDRRASREIGDVLDQVEQGRLRPVHVLEDEDERPVQRKPLEHATHPEEALLER